MSKRREEGLNSFDEESSINGVIDEIITGCEPVRMWTDGFEPTDVNRRMWTDEIITKLLGINERQWG